MTAVYVVYSPHMGERVLSSSSSEGKNAAFSEAKIKAIAELPVGVALIDPDRNWIICNAELVAALALPPEFALEVMPPVELGRLLARHVYPESDESAIVDRLLRVIKHTGADAPPTRFQTWVKGKRTTIESMGRDGLIWMFVKEQLDEDATKRDTEQLTVAVENMAQGLMMLDGSDRIVVCNTEFARMYSVPRALMERGTSFDEIVAWRKANGLTSERLTGDVATAALRGVGFDPEVDDCFIERENGRMIRVCVRPTAGGGSVSTHVDITDEMEWDAETAQRQAELEQQNMRLDATMGAIPHGLAMFDAQHRLVMCNTAFVEINKVDPDLSSPGTDRETMIANSKANGFTTKETSERYFEERHQAIASGQPSFSEIELTDGRYIMVGHHPIADGGWVSFHQDISELRTKQALAEKRSEELEVHNERFTAAVNNMAHGLAMFDEKHRLVICNQPFIELYALPAELQEPGTHFHDIMRHRAKVGMIGEQAEIDELIEGLDHQIAFREASRDVIPMKNGRVVDILHQPMPGGGWVATHQDITEEIRSQELIAQRSAELEQQNMRFTAAVSNMSHGLAMYDAAHKLVICNEAYAELYQLTPELTKPGTSFWDVIAHNADHGMVTEADPAERRRGLLKTINSGEQRRHALNMINGRVIQVLHQPTPDGGWLATHEDITEEHRSAELIEHMAHHDSLTDLPNRLNFAEHLSAAEARVGRGEIMALLCLDLDRFKEINDTLGHSFGDQVLQEVSRRIIAAKREEEVAARMGGDEFTLLLGPLDRPHHAAIVAQRLIDSISEPIIIGDHQILTGTSIGIAVAPYDGTDGETLMRNADMALYRAKADGRGNYCFFEQGMDAQMRERRQLESGLREALERQQFTLSYQPLLDLTSNRVSGFEALLRWSHPELGPLAPSKFIPIAEESGLIVPIGHWVLRTACQTALDWPEHIHVAVNLSPAQFKDKKLVESIAETLEVTGLAPDRLELEITESLLLENAEANLRVLHRLRELGIRISMDDFGTGYSALNYLRSFPFDKIKIDRSFISDIEGHGDNELVNAVIGLGKSLGVMTTAEGVETEMQLDMVRDRGCTEVQGFLFSPPLPAAAATELLHVTEARAAAMAGISQADKKSG